MFVQVNASRDFSAVREMAIPMSGGKAMVNAASLMGVVVLFILAVVNVTYGVAPIVSYLWIATVIMVLWSGSREEGGLRHFLANRLGDVARRHFAEVAAHGRKPCEVRFGYRLLGHRFITASIAIDKIETVEWSTRWATNLAAANRKDWHVCVWFDHDNPAKSVKQKELWKPEQDIYIVGPFAARAKIESLGRQLVALLRSAGATLAETDNPTSYARQKPNTNRAERTYLLPSVYGVSVPDLTFSEI